jgi:hypothetical protein
VCVYKREQLNISIIFITHTVARLTQEDTKHLRLTDVFAYEYNKSDNKPTPLRVITTSVTTLSFIN